MKKTIVALVATIAMSLAVNAASVNWISGDMSGLSSFNPMWQANQVSFYLVGSAGYSLTSIIDGLKINDTSVLTGLTLDKQANIAGSPGFSAGGAGTKADFVPTNIAYGFAVLWNDGTVPGGDLKFAISKVGTSATFAGIGNANLNFGGAGNFTEYGVVPEPTSMALLALGIAAIGLRRRFKK